MRRKTTIGEIMKSVEAKVEKTMEKMERQLKICGAKIDELMAKAEKSGVDAESDYRKRIEELKAKREIAQAKLDELKTAGSGKWERFKVDVERAYDELQAAFKGLVE